MNKLEQVNEFNRRMEFLSEEGIRKLLVDLDVPYETAYDKTVNRSELIAFAMDRVSYDVGQEVTLLVDHHTDEDLLESIETNKVEKLIIKNIDFDSRQAWLVGCDGWAWLDELMIK